MAIKIALQDEEVCVVYFKPIRYMQGALVLCLLLFTQLALAGVIVAGQELGKSTWNDRSQLKPARYKVEEGVVTPYKLGPVLRLEGPLSGSIRGTAELFYDKSNTLVAARLFTKNPEKLLKRLVKMSAAKRGANNVFILGDLRLREGVGQRFIQISSPTFDESFSSTQSVSSKPRTNWLIFSVWTLAFLLLGVVWCFRMTLWAYRESLADYLVGMAIVSTVLYFVPETQLGFRSLVLGAYLVGYGLILTWALRTVRLSGWLPRKPFVELLWSLPATPILLLPVIARNMVKSLHYAGLVLLFAQLFSLTYYYFRPDLMMELKLLPAVGLFGGGIVRLYCITLQLFEERHWHPAVSVGATQVTWPIILAVGILMFSFQSILGFFSFLRFMLLPAIIIIILSSVFQIEWLGAAGIVLPFLGLLSGVGGALVAGLAPTGYSNLDFSAANINPATGLPMVGGFDSAGNAFGFSGFDFNPANGMPMIGGLGGIDSFGNPFGSNMNDPW